MADYQETARIKIKELSSKNPKVRREAALYLGEAGVDEAITKLATMYKSDPDKNVRKAAEYSLGMFRAVEQALKYGEEDKVVELLRGVVEEGKMGKRRSSGGAVVRTIFLLLLLVVLVGANFVPLPGLTLQPIPGLPNLGSTTASNRQIGSADPTAFTEQLRTTYTAVNNDATTLLNQYLQVLSGGQLNCTAFFNNAEPLAAAAGLAADNATLAQAAESLSSAHQKVSAAYARYRAACFENRPLEIAEVGGQLAELRAAVESLTQVNAALMGTGSTGTGADSTAPAAPTAVDATPEPTVGPPTETPLPPTPTIVVPVADPLTHVRAMYAVVDDLRDPRGANGLLRQYWTEANSSGVTRACDEPRPELPAPYELPDLEAQASPELAQAAEQVNIAIRLVNDGWQLFGSACGSNALFQQSGTGLQIADAVDSALTVAEGLLNAVRNAA